MHVVWSMELLVGYEMLYHWPNASAFRLAGMLLLGAFALCLSSLTVLTRNRATHVNLTAKVGCGADAAYVAKSIYNHCVAELQLHRQEVEQAEQKIKDENAA